MAIFSCGAGLIFLLLKKLEPKIGKPPIFNDLSFVSSENIIRSVNLCENIVDSYEDLKIYKRLKMKGEPFLSKYDLYSTLGQSSSFNVSNKFTKSLMWLLNLSDGQHDLSMIAERSKIDIKYLNYVTQICLKKNLIKEI